ARKGYKDEVNAEYSRIHEKVVMLKTAHDNVEFSKQEEDKITTIKRCNIIRNMKRVSNNETWIKNIKETSTNINKINNLTKVLVNKGNLKNAYKI
ncbi:6542_t:CDS:1, partial [Cetraspora pellucida]